MPFQDSDQAEVAEVGRQLQLVDAAPHEILGVRPDVSATALVLAFQRLVKRFHPTRYSPGSQVREDARRALVGIRAAYVALMREIAVKLSLSSPRVRQEAQRMGGAPPTRTATTEIDALREALALVRERDWSGALVVLERALVEYPASSRCLAYVYLVRGHLAEEAGHRELALAAWRNALACDGTLSAARNALVMHERPRR